MTSKGIKNHNENLGVKDINTPQDPSLSNESKKPIRKESGLKFDPMTYKFRVTYIVLLVVMTCIVVATRDRMPQDESYHKLADDRRLVKWIPNTLDVISNLAFLLVSFHGLRATMNAGRDRIEYIHEKLNYLLFFAAVGLVGVGSTYYHLQPSTWRLFWDRLPMALAFASIFSILISEKIDRKSGGFLLGPLLVIAFLSVVNWIYTELNYHGDLRMYIATQFGITLVAPFIHFLFDSRYTHSYFFLLCMTFNLAAKICEMLDKRIFEFSLNTVSGHTLKHILSSIAAECIVLMLMNRTKKFKKKIE